MRMGKWFHWENNIWMKYVKGEILARDCKKTRPKSTDYKFPMKKNEFQSSICPN